MQVKRVLAGDVRSLPDALHCAGGVTGVAPHVLKKVAGVQNADSIRAVIELQLPSTVRARRSTPPTWPCSSHTAENMRRCVSSSGSSAQNAAAPVQDLRKLLEVDHSKVLVLQGVQEPGNVGTLIRTAAALGWSAVCLTDDCTDPFSDKAMRAARGASLRVRCLSHAHVDTLFVCLCASLWLRIKHMLKAHSSCRYNWR